MAADKKTTTEGTEAAEKRLKTPARLWRERHEANEFYEGRIRRRMVMFVGPLKDLRFEDVENFCKERIPEGISVEYKRALPEDIPKAISSFANTNGGWLLLGVETDKNNKPRLPIKGFPFESPVSDTILNACVTGIFPPVFPSDCSQMISVPNVGKKAEDRYVVVARIDPSLEAPHVVTKKRNRIYIRVESQALPYELADIDTIQYLLERRKDPQERKNRLLRRAVERLYEYRGATHPRSMYCYVILCYPRKPIVKEYDLYMFAQGLSQYNWRIPRRVSDGVAADKKPSELTDRIYQEINQFGLLFKGTYFKEPPPMIKLDKAIYELRTVLTVASLLYHQVRYCGLVEVGIVFEQMLGCGIELPFSMAGVDAAKCIDRTISVRRIVTVSYIKQNLNNLIGEVFNDLLPAFDVRPLPERFYEPFFE